MSIKTLNQEIIEEMVGTFKMYGEVRLLDNVIVANFEYTLGLIIETATIDGQDKMRLFLSNDTDAFVEYDSDGEQLDNAIDFILEKKRFYEAQEDLDLDNIDW